MDLSIFDEFESNVRSYVRSFPVVFAKADGVVLTDEDGSEYLDFLSGAGTLNYGHNNPILQAALIEYLQSGGVTHGLDLATVAKRQFIETFSRLILKPRGLDYKLQFTGPTGANAVEAALKLARMSTGRSEVVAFTHAFHGVSVGALATTANRKFRDAAGVPLGNVTFVPYDGYVDASFDSIRYLERLLGDPSSGLDRPAAVIVETIQGEGGVNVARVEWLQALSELCNREGIVLIVDDIQVGCGRTGTFFSFEQSGIVPDIVILSKSLSGYGLPMSLVLMRRELDIWKPGSHSGTFRGNNLAFVGATVALETYWSDSAFSERVLSLGEVVKERLERIAARHSASGLVVRGRGMIWGIVSETHPDIAKRVSEEAFTRGLIIETSGAYGEVLKLLSPLTISDEELERGLAIIEQSFDVVLA